MYLGIAIQSLRPAYFSGFMKVRIFQKTNQIFKLSIEVKTFRIFIVYGSIPCYR